MLIRLILLSFFLFGLPLIQAVTLLGPAQGSHPADAPRASLAAAVAEAK